MLLIFSKSHLYTAHAVCAVTCLKRKALLWEVQQLWWLRDPFLSGAKKIKAIHCVCLIFGLNIICHFVTHSFAIERTFETASYSASLPAAVGIQSDFLSPSSIWQWRQVSWVRNDKTFSKSWYHLSSLYGKILWTCPDSEKMLQGILFVVIEQYEYYSCSPCSVSSPSFESQSLVYFWCL